MVDQQEMEEQTQKTISLRLNAFDVAHIDVIAEECRMSRQAVLEKFVLDSIRPALAGVIESRSVQDDDKDKAYLESLNKRVIEKGTAICAEGGVEIKIKGWALKIWPDLEVHGVQS